MKYVIVGGGIAGISCVEGIRSLDREGEITLVCAEEFSGYGRPLISYYLEGKTSLERMSVRGPDFYRRNRVAASRGVSVERLDPAARLAFLSDGAALPYDRLCLCAGAVPFFPEIEGLDAVERKFPFTTLADALALERAVTSQSRVLILGAGLIGLKAAEGLAGRAASVTVCDLAPHVLSSVLTPESAALVEDHLRSKGIRLLLGDSARRFEGGRAILGGGEAVPFDALVVAVGVRGDTALARAAGCRVDRGVVVDEYQETTLPGVYAAGDCVGPYLIWPHAAEQGRRAGENMAGGRRAAGKSVPMNSLGLLGLHVMTAGSYEGEEITQRDGRGFRQFFVKDGKLSGMILVGAVERAGIYTAMIREGRPLEGLDLAAAPTLLPFGEEYRARTLGGIGR